MKDLSVFILEQMSDTSIVYRSDIPDKPLQCLAVITDPEEWDKFIAEYSNEPDLKFFLADENFVADMNTEFMLLRTEHDNILVNVDDERDMYDPHEHATSNPHNDKYIIATTSKLLEEK